MINMIKKMTKGKVLMILIVPILLISVVISGSFAATDFEMIDTAQLHSMVVDNAYKLEGGREKQFTVIDARPKEEYDETHIFSAISIPEEDFEKSKGLLPRDRSIPLVVYCNDITLDTAMRWAVKAVAAGYKNVAIYKEGFLVWKEKRMPVAPLSSGSRNP